MDKVLVLFGTSFNKESTHLLIMVGDYVFFLKGRKFAHFLGGSQNKALAPKAVHTLTPRTLEYVTWLHSKGELGL